MRALIFASCLSASLAGCASGPPPASYGNFIRASVPAHDRMIADDVAKKLVVLYPPARTRINLRQPASDAFGVSLVSALRKKGYALAETRPAASQAQSASAAAATPQSDDIALAYVIDQPLEPGLYRVTVLLNSQSLSRLYQTRDGSVAPAGYWIRKE